MDMANGWIIVRPMNELERLREYAESLFRNKSAEGVGSLLDSLRKDGADEQGQPGDSVLYINFTKRRAGNSPKRPNDGTKRKTVASGWFEDDEDINQFASQPWYEYRERIGRVEVLDPWAPHNSKYLFDGLTNCREFNLLKMDTSRCVSFEGMFRGCSSVSQLFDLGRFATSAVTNTSQMFMNCLALRTVNISGWDVSNVGESASMFAGCSTYVLSSEEQTAFVNEVTPSSMEKGVWRKTNQ